MALVISDPTYAGHAQPGAIERLALRLINDPRDLPFLRLMALETVTVVPFGLYLLVPGTFHLGLALAYLVLTIGVMLGPFILMLHNTSHRRLFRARYGLLNEYIPWVLGPFFGETPWTYYAHHIGMHHPENNLPDDLSSTMDYQRDSVRDFMRYFLRFLVAGMVEMSRYFAARRRSQLLRRMLAGELTFIAIAAALMVINWRGALTVLVAPLVITRFLMMAGNWGQHAFIDATAPENCYRNSITCINCGYNRRCFNDGYHISHHWKATRHWTEHPAELIENEATYRKEGALVFAGIDFFIVWLLLMLKRYDWLADRVVLLDGERRSKEETIAILRARTQRIRPRPRPRPAV